MTMRWAVIAVLALLTSGCGHAPEVKQLARGDGVTGCERVSKLRQENITVGTEYSIDNALCWIERNTDYKGVSRPSTWLELEGSHMYHLSNATLKMSAAALYSCTNKAVYFRKGFDPKKLGDQSILVHELVHHAQCLNGKSMRDPVNVCEREKEAYAIQGKFLRYVAGQRPDDSDAARLIEAAAKIEAGAEISCKRPARTS